MLGWKRLRVGEWLLGGAGGEGRGNIRSPLGCIFPTFVLRTLAFWVEEWEGGGDDKFLVSSCFQARQSLAWHMCHVPIFAQILVKSILPYKAHLQYFLPFLFGHHMLFFWEEHSIYARSSAIGSPWARGRGRDFGENQR